MKILTNKKWEEIEQNTNELNKLCNERLSIIEKNDGIINKLLNTRDDLIIHSKHLLKVVEEWKNNATKLEKENIKLKQKINKMENLINIVSTEYDEWSTEELINKIKIVLKEEETNR